MSAHRRTLWPPQDGGARPPARQLAAADSTEIAVGSGAPRPPGVLSDFTLRTDKQAVSWLRTERDINRFLAPWLDEIEEFRFDVEHVPGRLNPADLLTRRHFPGHQVPGRGPLRRRPPLARPLRRRSPGPDRLGRPVPDRGLLRRRAPLRTRTPVTLRPLVRSVGPRVTSTPPK